MARTTTDEMLALFRRADECEGAAIAEVGVHVGYSAIEWRKVFRKQTFYAFDTYTGSPRCKLLEDELDQIPVGTDVRSDIEEFLLGHNIIPVKGLFPDEVWDRIPGTVCFAYLDANNYATTKAGLDIFADRLTDGGLIALHDYYGTTCPGVPRAVHEFLDERPEFRFIEDPETLNGFVAVTR